MVKFISLFFLVIFISCSTKTRTLENKITDVPLDNKVFKNKMFFESELFNQIDTNTVYKEEFGYQSKKNSFEKINNLKEYQNRSVRGYYRFYSNGCVNYFSFQDFDEITFSSLAPNFNGQRGIIYSEENVIKLDLFTIIGYSFKRDYGIITSILKVKGDTLFEKKLTNPSYVNVYVRRKIPKEFLIYKPDW
ncbi:hypothetical protein SAMN06265346_11282 [Flavobacterium hercynium]|uniref:Lipoprotein n=1 Tax=Flavobacterium hercynium TaxID=387094 RepID=A0A226HLR0_9FLAO|nr:hypothetical protein B0A66_04960 [Flavobacterium hercynium]SMP29598.1 hypothetical protein SAMN06265346_11282 [Flavobacterium hercynium]